MQYIFSEKNFILMVVLAVKLLGNDVKSGNANKFSFISGWNKMPY